MGPVKKRRVFRLRWVASSRMWVLFEGRVRLFFAARLRTTAIDEAASYARLRYVEGDLTQLVVHHKGANTIAFERTYGRDPRRHVG